MGIILSKPVHVCYAPSTAAYGVGTIWQCDDCRKFYLLVEITFTDKNWQEITENQVRNFFRDEGKSWIDSTPPPAIDS